jgi:putative integral membrane protein (TIGR02587 family)
VPVAAAIRSGPGPWQRELDDFVRAISGAFLFGIPLLYTMEMWWLGTHSGPITLLLLLGIALAVNFGLTHVAGFRSETTFGSKLADTIDVVAVGVVASAVVLLILNRIGPSEPLETILAKIVVQTMPLSIGASVANALFSPDKDRQGDDSGGGRGAWQPILRDLGATAAGAAFIGFSVAPTEEIPMLAAGLDFGHLLALIVFSLLLTYGIVFESGFGPRRRRRGGERLGHGPLSETLMAYVVALAVSAAALTFYNQATFQGPLASAITQVVVLGLPSAIGGAAGRLVYE